MVPRLDKQIIDKIKIFDQQCNSDWSRSESGAGLNNLAYRFSTLRDPVTTELASTPDILEATRDNILQITRFFFQATRLKIPVVCLRNLCESQSFEWRSTVIPRRQWTSLRVNWRRRALNQAMKPGTGISYGALLIFGIVYKVSAKRILGYQISPESRDAPRGSSPSSRYYTFHSCAAPLRSRFDHLVERWLQCSSKFLERGKQLSQFQLYVDP